MKKLLAILLVLALMLSAFVACGPDDDGDDGLLPDGGDGEKDPILPSDGSDPAMPDIDWPADLPLN